MGSSASVSDCPKTFINTPLGGSSLDFDPTCQVKTPGINPTNKDAPGKCLATSKWIITLQGTNISHQQCHWMGYVMLVARSVFIYIYIYSIYVYIVLQGDDNH